MFLTEEDKKEIKQQIGELKNHFEVLLFSKKINCQYCGETEALLKEVSDTLEKMKVNVYNPVLDEDLAKKYNVNEEELPAIIFKSDFNTNSENIKFLGIPAGYEFAWFLSTVNMIANNVFPISQQTLEKIEQIKNILKSKGYNLDIMVFVTPSCPYCPIMGINSSVLSLLSDNVKTTIIDVAEFHSYAHQYSVMGVPKTVIKLNTGKGVVEDSVEGALPENKFIEKIWNLVSNN